MPLTVVEFVMFGDWSEKIACLKPPNTGVTFTSLAIVRDTRGLTPVGSTVPVETTSALLGVALALRGQLIGEPDGG